MYEAVLGLLLVVAALNGAARPFAFIMLANWAVNYFIVSRYGLYGWVPAVDAACFIGMALFTVRRPHWWSFLVAEMSFAAVAVHAAYWSAISFGLYLGPEYQIVLNGAFLVSALILVFGGYDIAGLVASIGCSLFFSPRLRGSRVHTRTETVENAKEDAR